ncbi:hypothetical protein RRG08_063707 [Elysia crispata]|uniref:Uncharacterized protein n=1 Tax=Elysia crispata TaxID=231223 RepID=A0AAE1ADI9_9GAST|nr:hypothetical protein RRG08_063707 [Elysia crispata]
MDTVTASADSPSMLIVVKLLCSIVQGDHCSLHHCLNVMLDVHFMHYMTSAKYFGLTNYGPPRARPL